MTANSKHVVRNRARTKHEVSDALAAGWFRVTKGGRKGALADAAEIRCTKTIDAAIAGRSVPELHTAFNSLLHDKTALDEVGALFDVKIVPLRSEAANDLETIAGLSGVQSEWLVALLDGIRDHRETKRLAELFRPLVSRMQAVIQEAEAA